MAVTALPMLSFDVLAAGSGTAEDPFLIYTAADMVVFAERVNAGNTGYCGKLMNDINISSISNWTPIAQSNGYTGTFDGNMHTISGLRINTSTTANLGLFGVINGGTVKNVAVTGANIVNSYSMTETRTTNVYCPSGYIELGAYIGPEELRSVVGGFVGDRAYMNAYHGDDELSWGSSNGYGIGPLYWAKVDVTADCEWYDDDYGWTDEWTENVYSGYVVGRGKSARHVGSLFPGSYNTYVTGYTASGAQSNAGGIAAVMNSGLIEGCSYSGTVNSNYARAGGLVGWQRGGTLSRCYSAGNVNGTYSAGGVGVLDGGTVINCYSTAYSTQYTKTSTIYSSSVTTPVFVGSYVYTPRGFEISENIPFYYYAEGYFDLNISSDDPRSSNWYIGYNPYTQKRVEGSLSGARHFNLNVQSSGALFRVDAYDYGAVVTNANAVVHQGYSNGFACAVSNSATIQNAYYFNESSYNKAFTNNNARGTSTYNLGTSRTYNSNSASLTRNDYASESNFTDWDFDDTWTISPTLGRPVLYSIAGDESITLVKVNPPQGGDAIFRVYADNPYTVSFNLAKYIKLTSGESTAGKFSYTITTGSDTANVQGDELVVRANLARGDYTVDMIGHDPTGRFKDFPVNLTIRSVTRILNPEATESGFEYTRSKHLSDIALTEPVWEWADGTIIPLNDNDGYDAIYNFNSDPYYLFDWTDVPTAVYDSASNKITAKVQIEVLRSAESPWSTYVTVRDADTGETVPSATVTHEDDYEFPLGHETDSDGRVYAFLTAGTHNLKTEKTGYDPTETEVTITESHNNEVTAYITPKRIQFKMPLVKTTAGETLDGAEVTAVRVSAAATSAWNNGDTAFAAAAGSEQPFPTGEFSFTCSTHGYLTTSMVYAVIQTDGIKYYRDKDHQNEITADDFIIYVEKSSDPMYHVTISPDSEGSLTYTAHVTLENIAATYGTFGLKFDPELFTFNPQTGITANSALVVNMTPESIYDSAYNSENGYYEFVWQSGGIDNSEFDTTGGAKYVADLTFTLKDAAYARKITQGTFSVMPWHKTRAAIGFEDVLKEDVPDLDIGAYYSEYWRWCDGENEPDSLTTGRLAKSKAVVNGIDTGGFYQARVSGGLAEETASYSYDVRTIIEYENMDIKQSVIKFHVIDADTGEDIENADVTLYDSGSVSVGTKQTDYMGETMFPTDINTSQAYTYAASANGYYPIPESGYSADRPTITTTAGESTLETVRLRKRIYHVPETADEKITVGGEKYGYNGEDYRFRIQAATGYEITKFPREAIVSVGDYTGIHLSVDEATQTFTLPAEYLNQRELTVEEMNALGYTNVIEPQPDKNGYRSYNIIVVFEDYDTAPHEYEVTAQTGAHGSVSYNRAVPFTDGLAPEVDETDRKLIKTTPENRKTGTFTFTADEGSTVERVYINGLETLDYTGSKTFDYTFGEVDMDNDITVIFTNGAEPSEETVMTLVVGEYGHADISSPEERQNVRATRRVYINPVESLEFKAIGEEGYKLKGIEDEERGRARTPVEIYPDNEDYTYIFRPPDSGGYRTVYVTFADKLAPEDADTPTVFVKSYRERGQGGIDPYGILIYNVFDTPEFHLKAKDEGEWYARGVSVSPFETPGSGDEAVFTEKLKENTYITGPLTDDTAIGAIFAEKGYSLRGYVDLSQGSALTTALPKSGAVVTFTRTDAEGNALEGCEQIAAATTIHRTDAVFTVELPEGIWTVTVTKPGYVRERITRFTFEKPENEGETQVFGDNGAAVKKITPYIGSARTGTSISLLDAAIVKTALNRGAEAVRDKADVDDDGAVRAMTDMTYVLFNYGVRAADKTYAEFLTGAQPDKP